MISRRNWERLGDVLAVVVALLLASVIVALPGPIAPTVSVHPTWAPKKLRVAQIGNHIFYCDWPMQISAVFRGSVQ